MNMNQIKLLFTTAFLAAIVSCGSEEPKTNDDQEESPTVMESEVDELDYSDMTMCDFTIDQVDLPYQMMLPIKTIGERPMVEHKEEVTWHVKLNDKFHLTIDDWGKEVKTIEKIKERLILDNGVFDLVVNTEDDDEIIYTLNGKNNSEIGGFNHFCLIKEIEGTYFTIQSHYFGSFSLSRVNDMLRAAKSFKSAKEEA